MSGVEAVAWSVPTELPPEFPWRKRESERVTKLTKDAQPEHGFTAALYSQATVDALRAQLEAAELRAVQIQDGAKLLLAGSKAAEAKCAAMRERIRYLAADGCVPNFRDVPKDLYQYAMDCAYAAGRQDPNDEDLTDGLCCLIDAAMSRTKEETSHE